MRQTEEKNGVVQEMNSSQNQFKNERGKLNKKLLVIFMIALAVAITIAIILFAALRGKNLKECDSPIDLDMNLVCDNCAYPIPCLDGKVHSDVNNDLICDNCGAGIASSDVSVYKEIVNEEIEENKVNVRGTMPTDTKVSMTKVSYDEATSLAQQFLELESKDVVDAFDISLTNGENIKYQPADDGESVKVTISDLNVEPSKGPAMLHIVDENNYEIISLNRATSREIEFTTNHFSTYILIYVGKSEIKFEGTETYSVLDGENTIIGNEYTVTNNADFKFKITPNTNYEIEKVVLQTQSGDIIEPSENGLTIFSVSDLGITKECIISSVNENLSVIVTTKIKLTNPINLTAVTDGVWTSGDIVIEIDWPVTDFTKQIKIDDGEWQDYSDRSYTMEKNGILYARVFDGTIGSEEISVTISNIDKTKPVIKNVRLSNQDWTSGELNILYALEDSDSGVKSHLCTHVDRYATDIVRYNRECTLIDKTPTSVEKEVKNIKDNVAAYYIRCADAAGNYSDVVTIEIRNIDKREPLFSNITTYTDEEFYQAQIYGKLKESASDITFKNGINRTEVYNNNSEKKVTLERVKLADEGIEACPGSDSEYALKITNKGTASPGLGGFVRMHNSVPDSVFVHRFIAKIPKGYTVKATSNEVTGERVWLTNSNGTGEWTEYAYMQKCDSWGNFGTFGHVYISGGAAGTETNPLVWYVGLSAIYDVTHIFDDIEVSYDDTSAATITIRAYDNASGIKNIKVNGEEIPIDNTESSYTDGILTKAVAMYKVTEAGTYTITATDNAGNSTSLTREAYSITYHPNAPEGENVTGETIKQIRIGNVENANYANDSTKYSWLINLRNNAYKNSAGTPFRGWAISTDGLPAYPEGAVYKENKNIDLYAVWNDAIEWDVSKLGDGSVIASLIPNENESTYTLKVSGTGMMKDWDSSDYSSVPWYSYRASINTIRMEDGVTNIGGYAFYETTGIKSVSNISIADSVTGYGNLAFGECTQMDGEFVVSDMVESIGNNPFAGCILLDSIKVAEGNSKFKSVSGVLFTSDGEKLIAYPIGNNQAEYTITDGTITLGSHAFMNMSANTIKIPNTVEKIEDNCFKGAGFTILSIPGSVTELGSGAFNSLENIDKIYYHPKSINLPHDATFTGAKAGSTIYTVSDAVVKNFVDGLDYNSANTTLVYPPKITGQPDDKKIEVGTEISFRVSLDADYSGRNVKVQWQYRKNGSDDWKNVTNDVGSVQSGIGNQNVFRTYLTINNVMSEMNGYQFRCKFSDDIYPGEEFTEEEISSHIISNVASITIIEKNYLYGDGYYRTIDEVLKKIYSTYPDPSKIQPQTITINKSIEDDSECIIKPGYKFVLDTNGNTVTKTGTPIINNGELSIIGTGEITTSSESDKTLEMLVENNGVLTIDGATLRHKGTQNGDYFTIANTGASSSIVVKSGAVIEECESNTSATGKGVAIYSEVESSITIENGTVASNSNNANYAIQAKGTYQTSIYIKGGIVNSVSGSAIYITPGDSKNTTSSFLHADGGEIGGEIYGIVYDAGCNGLLRVNGAIVTGGEAAIMNSGNSEILLLAGAVTAENVAISNGSNGPINIKGGTIEGKVGILNKGDATKVTIYNTTINSSEYGIHNNSASEVEIQAGTIHGNMVGVYNNKNGKLTVLDGNITSNGNGILDNGEGTIIIGEKDAAIRVNAPIIQGDEYGVKTLNSNLFDFYDGKIKGKIAPYYKEDITKEIIGDTEPGYAMYETKEGDYFELTLRAGWDISANNTGVSTAWATIEKDLENEDRYKLIIVGNGAMKDFTEYNVPWLSYRSVISTVEIGEGITNIGANALYNMEALETLIIPETIESIGDHAFKNCLKLSGTFTIPSNVTSIGINPFANSGFEDFEVDEGNTRFVIRNHILYNKDRTELIAYPTQRENPNLALTSTVTTVKSEAFYKTKVDGIRIPSLVTTIEARAFQGAEKISAIVIGSGEIEIGDYAFKDINNLKNVYLKSEEASIGNYAFCNIASDSVIYTKQKSVAEKFIDGNQYESSNTKIYYPPVITSQPTSQAITEGNSVTFSVQVTAGVPDDTTYIWQYKSSTGDWTNTTSTDGNGYNTSTFVIPKVTSNLDGNEYRCVISTSAYPNVQMTSTDLGLTSEIAVLTVNEANYQVGTKVYHTLKEAVDSVTTSAATTIEVISDNIVEKEPVTIVAKKDITIDFKDKIVYLNEINNQYEPAYMYNNGKLTLSGDGGIVATNIGKGVKIIHNEGTLNILSGTYRNENCNSGDIIYPVVVRNIGKNAVINMSGGKLEALNLDASFNGGWSVGVFLMDGKINMSGGTINSSGERYAYGIVNAGYRESDLEINMTGGEIYSDYIGIAIEIHESTSLGADAQIKVSGTSKISGARYGINNYASTKDIYIDSGTVIGGEYAVHNEMSNTIIGSSDAEVSIKNPIIISESNTAISGDIYFYDGILKGKYYISSEDIITEEGYGIQQGSEGLYKTIILSVANYTDGISYYASLNEAFERAPHSATIKPVKDLEDKIDATLAKGQNFDLDLNGKTIRRDGATITNAGRLRISGDGYLTSKSDKDLIVNSGTLTIKGGAYELESTGGSSAIIRGQTGGRISISGGNLNLIKTEIDNGENSISGIVIEGGSLSYNSGELHVINEIDEVNCDINGVKINADKATVQIKGGTIIVDGNATNKTSRGISIDRITDNTSTLTISGGKIKANADNMKAYGVYNGEDSVQEITISSGEIYGGECGVYNPTTATIIGTSGDELSTTSPLISGESYGVSGEKIYLYDGVLKGKIEAYSGNIYTQAKFCVVHGVDGEYKTATIQEANYCVTPNIYTMTLKEAIEKCIYNRSYRIELLRDVEDNSEATIPKGEEVVIQLNDYTLNRIDNGFTNYGTLEIRYNYKGETNDTSTLKIEEGVLIRNDGELYIYCEPVVIESMSPNDVTIINNGYVELDKLTLKTANTAIKSDSGEMLIYGDVEISAGKNALEVTGGSVTIEDATIVGEECALCVDGGDVLFKGGVLKGKNSAISGNVRTENGKSIYYYTEGEYNCARLETGWDISEKQDGTIYAYLMPNDSGYRLEVVGKGETKLFELNERESIPWYQYRENITELTISEGITGLGAYVFSDLITITKIDLPSTLEEIGEGAFYNDSSITSTITIPASVKKIEANPFCFAKVQEIIVEDGNTNFKVENNMLMTADGTRVIAYPIGITEKKVTIPEGVTTLSKYSFAGMQGEELIISASVKTLEGSIVEMTPNLAKVYFLGEGFELIGINQFNQMKDNSVIYTRSSGDAAKFYLDAHHTKSKTTIYYPPVVDGTLLDARVFSNRTATFEVTATPGVPEAIKYNWEVKRAGTETWLPLMDGQGLNTAKYTTVQLTEDNSGDEFRCVINSIDTNGNTIYPNEYMPITDLDISEKLISDTAKVYVRDANYVVNTKDYFDTLGEAISAYSDKNSIEVQLLRNIEDNSIVNISENQDIILWLAGHMLNRKDGEIVNKGTLDIYEGTLKIENGTLIKNEGTLLLDNEPPVIESESIDCATIINSGDLEINELEMNTKYTAIQNISGTANLTNSIITIEGSTLENVSGVLIDGGTINVDGSNVELESKRKCY